MSLRPGKLYRGAVAVLIAAVLSAAFVAVAAALTGPSEAAGCRAQDLAGHGEQEKRCFRDEQDPGTGQTFDASKHDADDADAAPQLPPPLPMITTTTTVPPTTSTSTTITTTTVPAPTRTTNPPPTTTTTTGTSTPTTTPPPPPPNGSNPTGEFYVVGNQIIDPNGHVFVPVGANVGTTLAFDWRGIADGHAADAKAWGWNSVRLTMVCTNGAPWDEVSTYGYPALLAQVDSIVKEYTAAKIVVDIECHDMSMEGSGGLASAGTPSDPLLPQLDRFWTDMAKAYKGNPYVWFNSTNEPPNDNTWVWLQQHFLSIVRGQGAENLFVADGPNAGEDAGWGGTPRMYDPSMGPTVSKGQCNVLFSVHNYGGTATDVQTWTDYVHAMHAAGLPLVGGEFGYTIDGSSTAGNYQLNHDGAQVQFSTSPSLGVGMWWWHGTHGDNYSLKADGDAFFADGGPGSNLSAGGQQLWNVGHAPPPLDAFTGDLRSSHCPSTS